MNAYCARSFGAEIQGRELGDPNFVTYLVDSDDKLIAFAQLRLDSCHSCLPSRHATELYRIYVSSDWQGSGIAHKMMKKVLALAGEKGSDYLWLGVWEENPKAIAFYEKYGFRTVGEQEFQLGDEIQRDLIMAVTINGPN